MQKSIKLLSQAGFDLKLLLSCIIALFIIICYCYNRSFFIDEAALGYNINTRSYLGLTDGLSKNQSAPLLFLWISKTINTLFPSDLFLRFFPVLCSLLSLVYLYKISLLKEVKAIVKEEKHYLMSFILLLSCTIFYRYGTEFKQYSTELFVTIFLQWLLLQNRYISAILWLILAIGITSISPILFVMCISSLIIDFCKINKKDYVMLCIMSVLYAIVFLVNLQHFFVDSPVKAYMQDFWQYAFAPKDLFSTTFYIWIVQRVSVINYNMFFYNIFNTVEIKYLLMPLPFVLMLFQSIGIYKIIRSKHWKMFVLLVLPIFIHLVLSYFQLYPFDTRLLFYLLINILLLTTIGLASVKNIIIKYFLPIVMFISFVLNFPYKNEEVKSHLQYINKHIKTKEVIYIFNDINHSYQYYLQDKLANLDFTSNETILGKYNKSIPNMLEDDISRLEYKKGYLLFGNTNPLVSRATPFDFNVETFTGRNFIATDETVFIDSMQKLFVTKKIASLKGSNLYAFQPKYDEK